MHKFHEWTVLNLLHRKAEQLFPSAVDLQQNPVTIGDAEQIFGDVEELIQFVIADGQFSLQPLALGDVVYRADHPLRFAVLVTDHFGLIVDETFTAIRQTNTVIQREIRTVIQRSGDRLVQPRTVLGMRRTQEQRERHRHFLWAIAVQAVGFVRPCERASLHIKLPIAHMSNALRVRQAHFALAQGIFQPFAFGDVTGDVD